MTTRPFHVLMLFPTAPAQQREHFQWMDRAAYEAYRASELGQAAASLLVSLHPQVFFLREMDVIV